MKGMTRKSGVLGPRERRGKRCHGAGSAARAALGIATRGRGGLLLTGMVLLAGCDGLASEVGMGTQYGREVPVGQGTIRSYVILEEGRATEVGVAFSEGALEGLPPARDLSEGSTGGHADHMNRDDVEYLLDLPVTNPTAYRFVEVNWNPRGHPPAGIYDVAHFDVHFYTIALSERDAIDPEDGEFKLRAGRLPSPGTTAEGFVPHHALEGVEPWQVTVPRMGMHWVNPAGAEFNGGPFTAALLLGSWDGRFIFAEPMVALDFLRGNPDMVLDIPSWGPNGRGEALRVYRDTDADEVRIALLNPQPR
jgi:hypothetical protein